jgi:hypothetical protein
MDQEKLLVVWTSGDRDVALKMVFMYGHNAKIHGWWKQVTLLVWGASAKLLAGDEALQAEIKEMLEAGVRVIACKQCATEYGVVETLEALGIEVFYTGQFLTEWVKSGAPVLTF